MLLSGRINIQVGSSSEILAFFILFFYLANMFICFKSPTASYIFNTSYCGCICQSYGSRLEPNTAHTPCVFVRPDELRWWEFNFQFVWLRPMLVAYQCFPNFALRGFYRYKNHETTTHNPTPLHHSPPPVLHCFNHVGFRWPPLPHSQSSTASWSFHHKQRWSPVLIKYKMLWMVPVAAWFLWWTSWWGRKI